MDEVIEALHDPRVIRMLELALRDARIRRRFQRLRREMTVLDACETLAEEFYLSPERVKSIHSRVCLSTNPCHELRQHRCVGLQPIEIESSW